MAENTESLNCWGFDKTSNEFWDFLLPEWLTLSILQKSQNWLIDLRESVIVRNQFRTYLASIMEFENVSQELKHEIYERIIDTNLDIWDENGDSEWSHEYLLNFHESEFMELIIYDAISNFLNNWWTLPDNDLFSIDSIDYSFRYFVPDDSSLFPVTENENQTTDVNGLVQSDSSFEVDQNYDTLTEFLDENWIPESSKEIIRWLFEKYWAFSENISEEDLWNLHQNLWVLIKFIVAVESSWGRNIINTEWSSAKWPFQYLDWYINWTPTTVLAKDENGNPVFDENWNEIRVRKYDRETWDYSPFDTALRRNMEYYASQAPDYANDYYNYSKYSEYIPEWVIESYENQPELSPLDLSWEESINMWLVDSFCRSKTQEYMSGIILHWNASDMKRFYNRIHHTSPDAAVNTNVQNHFDIFASQLSPVTNLIFSPLPVERPSR